MQQNYNKLVEYLDEKFEKTATKKDLEKFATKQDLNELKQGVDKKFDRAFDVFATKDDVKDLKQDVDGLRETVQALVVSVDKLVGAVSDLKVEYTAVKHQLSRHEKWIRRLAKKAGMQLEY